MDEAMKAQIIFEYGATKAAVVIEAANDAIRFKIRPNNNLILFGSRAKADKWSHEFMKAGIVHYWIGDNNWGFTL